MTRIRACAVGDLPEGEALQVDHDPKIALFHTEGTFFAIDDLCTHEDASLSEGWIEDDCQVTCPWHDARFCLKTGAALTAPAHIPVRTHAVTVEDGFVWIDVTD